MFSRVIALCAALAVMGPLAADPQPAQCTVHFEDEQQMPDLYRAYRLGGVASVESMLQLGADVNATNCQGQTALHYAVAEDDMALARLLIRHGASLQMRDGKGNSPFQVALKRGHSSMAEELLVRSIEVR